MQQPEFYNEFATQIDTSSDLSAWVGFEAETIEMAQRLDATTAPVLEQTTDLLLKTGAKEFILDASRTTFMTGAGLRAILSVARRLQQSKGRLAICNLTGQPRAMFEACGFENIIAVFDRTETAKQAFAG